MNDRTKKRKDNTNNLDKTKLWNIFDNEIKNDKKTEPLNIFVVQLLIEKHVSIVLAHY